VQPKDTLDGVARRLAERNGWYGQQVEWFRHEHLGRIENMTMEEMRRLMQDHEDDPANAEYYSYATAMYGVEVKWA
jgi:hypothetical protein